MHVHVSALSTLLFALQLLVVGFVIRTIQTTWPDSSAAKALAYLY